MNSPNKPIWARTNSKKAACFAHLEFVFQPNSSTGKNTVELIRTLTDCSAKNLYFKIHSSSSVLSPQGAAKLKNPWRRSDNTKNAVRVTKKDT